MITKTYNKDYSDLNYNTYKDDIHVELPEVIVYPDELLLQRMRLAYPNKYFRDKITRTLEDLIYECIPASNDVANKIFYPSDLPFQRLLDIHAKSNFPTIVNGRHSVVPDLILKNILLKYDNEELPENSYYRAHTVSLYPPFINYISLDYALPGNQLLGELLSEYSHLINSNLNSYFNLVGPYMNPKNYNRNYNYPGTNEWYAHKVTEPYLNKFVLPRRIRNEILNTKIDELENSSPEEKVKLINAADLSIKNLGYQLNLNDLSKALHLDIKKNPPSKDYKIFWNIYNKLNPNNGVGGGGEW